MAWLFGAPNYERDITRLTADIRAARIGLFRTQAAQRRLTSTFTWIAIILFVLHAAFALFARPVNPLNVALLVASPFIWYAIRYVLGAILDYLVISRESRVEGLVKRREKLVSEYKEKTNYDKIKKVLDDAEKPEVPAEGMKTSQRNPGPNAKKNAPRAPFPPHANIGHGGARGQLQQGVHTSNLQSPHTAPTERFGGGPGPNLPNGPDGTPNVNLPYPPFGGFYEGPSHTTWMDRIINLVLGENEASPANRQALICAQCYTHNGLAPYGQDASEVIYRCSTCGFLNDRQQDPFQDRPKSEQDEEPVAEPKDDTQIVNESASNSEPADASVASKEDL